MASNVPTVLGKHHPTCGLTPDVHASLVHAFGLDPSISTAASRCGVAYSTLRRWLAKGRSGHPRYVDFFLDCAAARNEKKSEWQGNLERIAEGDTPQALRANLSLLARMFPDEWGDRDTAANEEHKAKANSQAVLKDLTPEELKLLESINAKRLAADTGDSDDD